MSGAAPRARELLSAYGLSLERQLEERGSCLGGGDQELWTQVEAELRDGDARDTHVLGLDPLAVMEETLAAAAVKAAGGSRGARPRGGGSRGGGPRGAALQGLTKAFQVLEQAALNLHLGPWRDEYKVVKMYSGTFTHSIKPVLSLPQIEKLFGMLGYELGPTRLEQLVLQRVGGAGPDRVDPLLRLSCAFYLAQCECRLLLDALGKRGGDAHWELSTVRERQQGSSVQVALESTRKNLRANQALTEPFDSEVDLYTDVSGGPAPPNNDDRTWLTQKRLSPPTARTHGDGAAASAREQVCVSTLSCQLSGTSPAPSGSSAGPEVRSGPVDLVSLGLCGSEGEVDRSCSCLLQNPHLYLNLCVDCGALHHMTCAALQLCLLKQHLLETGSAAQDLREPAIASSASPPVQGLRASPTSSSGAAMSAMSLREDPASMLMEPASMLIGPAPTLMEPPSMLIGPASMLMEPASMMLMASLNPIAFHDCCDLSRPDPQVLCHSCGVFHAASCRDLRELCRAHAHALRPLGACVCGKPCARKPLVLCRYCGNEFCRDCWYRNPVVCSCGQTFDQSSSV